MRQNGGGVPFCSDLITGRRSCRGRNDGGFQLPACQINLHSQYLIFSIST